MSINVVCINQYDSAIIEKIIETDTSGFGETTLSPYTMEAFIRFGKVFVILEDNKIIGAAEFIKSWTDINTVYLVGMAISNNKQNKGLGWSEPLIIDNKLSNMNTMGVSYGKKS